MVYLGECVGYEDQARDYDWEQALRARSEKRHREKSVARSVGRGLRRLKRLLRGQHGSRTMRMVRRHKTEGRLCDFGCGTGRLLMLARASFAVLGIDISEEAVAVARQRLPEAEILVGPVTTVRLPAESFDVVTMRSYLEHEQHPMRALEVARGTLKPGGIVVLKTPNYGSLGRRVRGRKWCGFRLPDHSNYFTKRTLLLALERAGFENLPGSVFDCMPTSDNMYVAAGRP